MKWNDVHVHVHAATEVVMGCLWKMFQSMILGVGNCLPLRSGGNCVRSDLFPTLLGLPFANDSSVGFSAIYLCETLL